MAARPVWKGVLRLGILVTGVKVFKATESRSAISFNQLHRACCTKINQKRFCAHCNIDLKSEDIVKGYEHQPDAFLSFEQSEIDDLQVESTHTIDVERFVDAKVIDPMRIDSIYYLGPNGQVFGEAFAVLREAMRGKAAIGKLAIYGREYAVAVVVDGRGMRLLTLRYDDEIRSMDAMVDELNALPVKVDKSQVDIAKRLVTAMEDDFDLSDYHDTYKDALLKLVKDRLAGAKSVAGVPKDRSVRGLQGDELVRSLRASLEAVSAKPRRAQAKAVPVTKLAKRRIA